MNFTWFKQSGFLFEKGDKKVYIDPYGLERDEQPADLILITHVHFDHFDPKSIEKIRTPDTQIHAPGDVAAKIVGAAAVAPGDTFETLGFEIKTVPAYNIKPDRLSFHPKVNNWVGYVIKFDEETVYHAGDTDHIPEMTGMNVDLALLPIGGIYTMDALEAGAAAKAINPEVAAIPMHYGAVVGGKDDEREFIKAASPVKVMLKDPKYPFTVTK